MKMRLCPALVSVLVLSSALLAPDAGADTIPITITDSGRYSFIANPLDHGGGNYLEDVLAATGGLQGGEVVLLGDCDSDYLDHGPLHPQFMIVLYNAGAQAAGYPSDWTDGGGIPIPGEVLDPDSLLYFIPPGTLSLPPGKGFFIQNPNPTEILNFTGTALPAGPTTMPCSCGKTNLVSSKDGNPLNYPKTYNDIVGSPPVEGSELWQWRGNGFTVFTFNSCAWSRSGFPIGSAPSVRIGEGVYIKVPCGPPNDLCANALPITLGITYGSTVNATPSPSGSLTGQYLNSPDVWYTFTTPCPGGLVTLDTCPDPCGGHPHFDTVLQVYTGTCGALLSQIAVNNNNPACANPLNSKVSFTAAPNVTYYIRVAGNLGATGFFALNAAYVATVLSAPANDSCAGATLIKCNETKTFQTCAATTGGPVTVGCPFNNDRWFKYIPDCNGTVVVDTCGSFFDTVLGVYRGSCGSLILDGCNDNATAGPCAGSPQSRVTFTATALTTYYIRVGGSTAGAVGTAKLSVTGPNPTLGTCPPTGCLVKKQRVFQLVGNSTANAWAWCLSSPCCFNLSGTVPAGTVASGQPAPALVAAMVASINAACPGLATQLASPNNSQFKIKACICGNCDTAFPFIFRVGAAGSSCDDMCIVNSPLIVSATGPCVFNPSISEVPLSGEDCNQNGEDDALDILTGTSLDADQNGVPDECQVRLNIAHTSLDNGMAVSWGATDAILEQSTNVTGPWSEVLGGASPYNVDPAGSRGFFRLRLP